MLKEQKIDLYGRPVPIFYSDEKYLSISEAVFEDR